MPRRITQTDTLNGSHIHWPANLIQSTFDAFTINKFYKWQLCWDDQLIVIDRYPFWPKKLSYCVFNGDVSYTERSWCKLYSQIYICGVENCYQKVRGYYPIFVDCRVWSLRLSYRYLNALSATFPRTWAASFCSLPASYVLFVIEILCNFYLQDNLSYQTLISK